jgi:hypothetical protein
VRVESVSERSRSNVYATWSPSRRRAHECRQSNVPSVYVCSSMGVVHSIFSPSSPETMVWVVKTRPPTTLSKALRISAATGTFLDVVQGRINHLNCALDNIHLPHGMIVALAYAMKGDTAAGIVVVMKQENRGWVTVTKCQVGTVPDLVEVMTQQLHRIPSEPKLVPSTTPVWVSL